MPDLSITTTEYTIGLTETLPDVLNDNQDALKDDGILQLDTNQAAINAELHGTGTTLDPDSDTVVQAGSGLSVQVINQAVYVGGRRYEIDELAGWLIVPVTASITSDVYLTKANIPTTRDVATYPDPQASKPAGTWYVGRVTADSDSVTAVDFSACDRVESISGLATRVETLETTATDHEGRIVTLEGGGGGGGASYATALPVSPTDATDTKTYIDAGDAATLAAALAAIPGTSGAGTGTTVVSVWDEFLSGNLQLAMAFVNNFPGTYSLFPQYRFIYADWAARGLPNYIHASSTMPYDATTGVFG